MRCFLKTFEVSGRETALCAEGLGLHLKHVVGQRLASRLSHSYLDNITQSALEISDGLSYNRPETNVVIVENINGGHKSVLQLTPTGVSDCYWTTLNIFIC